MRNTVRKTIFLDGGHDGGHVGIYPLAILQDYPREICTKYCIDIRKCLHTYKYLCKIMYNYIRDTLHQYVRQVLSMYWPSHTLTGHNEIYVVLSKENEKDE